MKRGKKNKPKKQSQQSNIQSVKHNGTQGKGKIKLGTLQATKKTYANSNDITPQSNLAERTNINTKDVHEMHYDKNVQNNQAKSRYKHQLTSATTNKVTQKNVSEN